MNSIKLRWLMLPWLLLIIAAEGAIIEGNISDASDGTPLENARVLAIGADPISGDSLRFEAFSDAQGDYRFGNLLDGIYQLLASADGYEPAQQGPFILFTTDSLGIDFLLQPFSNGNLLAGSIQDGITLSGIANARVTLSSDSGVVYEQFSAFDGGYSFSNIASGIYEMRAEANGYFQPSPITLTIIPDTHISDFIIQLLPDSIGTDSSATLSGNIWDATGNIPVFPAFIELANLGDSLFYAIANQPDGSYDFGEIQAGAYVARVNAPGYLPLEIFGLLIENGANTRDFLLVPDTIPANGFLSGSVTYDSSGTGVSNAVIQALSGDGSLVDQTQTLFNGSYALQLPQGDYYLALQIAADSLGNNFYSEYYDDAATLSDATPVTIIQNQATTGINFGIPDSLNPNQSASFSGTVTESDSLGGAPIYPAQLSLLQLAPPIGVLIDFFNRPDGTFDIDSLIPGQYLLICESDGYFTYSSENLTIVPGSNTLDIVLTPLISQSTGFISGAASFDDSGQPVAGAGILLFNSNGLSYSAHTNHQGTYFTEAPAGDYYVMLTYTALDSSGIIPPAYTEYYDDVLSIIDAQTVTIIAGDTTAGIDFGIPDAAIPLTATLSGTVTDDAGSPLAEAAVTIAAGIFNPGSDSLRFETLTDSLGNYSIQVNNGAYPLQHFIASAASVGYNREYWQEQPLLFLATPITVNSDTAIANIDFTLSETTGPGLNSISGTVSGDNGQAVTAIVMGANVNTGLLSIAVSDSLGHYTLGNLLPDPYIVLFAAEGYIPEFFDDALKWEDALPVMPTGNTGGVDAVLTLLSGAIPGGSGMVTGTISDDSGQSVPGALVTVMNASNLMIGFDISDSQGRYQVDGIFNGQLSVQVTKISFASMLQQALFNDANGATMILNFVMNAIPLGVKPDAPLAIPGTVLLAQNYPNPFNPQTTIRLSIPDLRPVRLTIYNLLGQQVRELINEALPAGVYSFQWNGVNASGQPVSSGYYFYSLEAGDFRQVRMMLLNR